jgi:hypothetical protein
MDGPPSPDALKTTFQALEPPTPSETKSAPSVVMAPNPAKNSPAKATPSLSAACTPPSPKLTESHKTTPLSPQSSGLGSAGGVPLSGDSAQSQPCGYPQ